MNALSELQRRYGDSIFKKRILLLHAGGLSQRQPNASTIGKIFTLLPREGSKPYCMLDLKLEICQPLLPIIPHGVFLVPADSIECFQLPDENLNDLQFPSTGFTVLAHPSPAELGTRHGVYVFNEFPSQQKSAQLIQVKRVLQKPSMEKMLAAGAIWEFDEEKCAFTDSCFYFGTDVMKKMLQFYKYHQPLVELDAYCRNSNAKKVIRIFNCGKYFIF